MKLNPFIIIAAVIGFIIYHSVYIITETEQVVITQFGEAIGKPIQTAGLKLKIPFVQKVNTFPKTLLEWDGEKKEINTKDKTYIWIDCFARWKIVDPLKYFQNVNNEINAQAKLDNFVNSAVRDLVASNPLIESVRNSNREMDLSGSGLDSATDAIAREISFGRSRICNTIIQQVNPKLAPLGMDVVDIKIKRINYTDQVLQNVYGRMIAERRQIAEKFRSEGRGESQKIHGEKERDLKRIYSEAYKIAEEIKGRADASATKIYAAAYNKDPEFYSFVKTLDLYRESFDSTSSMILSTQTDFLRYLKSYAPSR